MDGKGNRAMMVDYQPANNTPNVGHAMLATNMKKVLWEGNLWRSAGERIKFIMYNSANGTFITSRSISRAWTLNKTYYLRSW